jgi:hypothetical protein
MWTQYTTTTAMWRAAASLLRHECLSQLPVKCTQIQEAKCAKATRRSCQAHTVPPQPRHAPYCTCSSCTQHTQALNISAPPAAAASTHKPCFSTHTVSAHTVSTHTESTRNVSTHKEKNPLPCLLPRALCGSGFCSHVPDRGHKAAALRTKAGKQPCICRHCKRWASKSVACEAPHSTAPTPTALSYALRKQRRNPPWRPADAKEQSAYACTRLQQTHCDTLHSEAMR